MFYDVTAEGVTAEGGVRHWPVRVAMHAVTQAGWLRPVVEDMTLMAAAPLAMHPSSNHTERNALGRAHGIFCRGSPDVEFRPEEKIVSAKPDADRNHVDG